MESPDRTALIVVLPEAEPLVGDVRARYDPAAAEGVPAHVTVVYPFLPPASISAPVIRSLQDMFARYAGFRVGFGELRRFPGVLYLSPRPDATFRRLTEAVVERFPEAPPYGGQFTEIVPHLTLAHAASPARLDEIEAEFLEAASGRLPIHAACREVTMIERQNGRWSARMRFALGQDAALLEADGS